MECGQRCVLKFIRCDFAPDDCHVDVACAEFAQSNLRSEIGKLKSEWRLTGHQLAEMRHHQPTKHRFTCSQADGFCFGLHCVDYVVERAEKRVGCKRHAASQFVHTQVFADAIKQLCTKGFFQLLQLPTELTLPIRVRPRRGSDASSINDGTEGL